MKKALRFGSLCLGLFLSAQIASAQSQCGWTLDSQVKQISCHKHCDGEITLTPPENWGAMNFLWSDGSTGSSLMNLCAGTYTVTVTDDKECAQSLTFTIVEPAPLIASCSVIHNESGPGMLDGELLASATGGTSPYMYHWQVNPVVNNASLTGLGAGTYDVLIEDANHCASMSSCVIITEQKNDCDGFRTQTQGAWGQCQQNGNNPGTYLFAHFSSVFPSGLTIGSATRSLKLTSAQGVCDFLPSGTTPRALSLGNLVNPGGSYSNVLAGQLVAAILNTQFDLADPSFGNAGSNLLNLVVVSGPFSGMTMSQVIAEANKKIGGGSSPYSFSQLNAALTAFNQNYDNGTVDLGYLRCDGKENKRFDAMNDGVSIQIAPNPFNGLTKMSILATNESDYSVSLFNFEGKLIKTIENGVLEAGNEKSIQIDASELISGIYLVKAEVGGKIITKRINLVK